MNLRRARSVAGLEEDVEVVDDDDFWTIWAFCLRTSAGVRIRQEISSAVEEDRELIIGVGRRGCRVDDVDDDDEKGLEGLSLWRRDLVPS